MNRPFLIAALIVLLGAAAYAQSIGGMSGIGLPLGGATGNSSGGGGGTACTNQLVLDYSNSCALIAQGWGQ